MLGLKSKTNDKTSFSFSEKEKRTIVEDYLQSGMTKRAICKKYTGCPTEHGKILYWMRRYGYTSDHKSKNLIFASKISLMPQEDKKHDFSEFEFLQLQKLNSELEKQLRESQMQSIAWQTMIELAEKEFNISIKKKFNTKPSKK